MLDHIPAMLCLGTFTVMGLFAFLIEWAVRFLNTNEKARMVATALAKAAVIHAVARWFER